MNSVEHSNPNYLPGFVVAHDGTQAEIAERERERERAIVAQKFDSLVDDVLLNFTASVRHDDGPNPADRLSLRLPVNNTDYWSIAVDAKTTPDSGDGFTTPAERIRKSIYLQYIADGYGRDFIDYRLGADRVVRRHDGGDLWAKGQKEHELGTGPRHITPDMTSEEALGIIAMDLDHLINYALPNSRLERQMGYNMQPIGLQELDGLADLVTKPEVMPVSGY